MCNMHMPCMIVLFEQQPGKLSTVARLLENTPYLHICQAQNSVKGRSVLEGFLDAKLVLRF